MISYSRITQRSANTKQKRSFKKMIEQKTEKLVIVGSGPAGLTAAIYAARANLEPLVISGDQPGGQLMLTTDVDDFPGFDEGIQGPELMEKMRKQAERFGTRFLESYVESVNLKTNPFIINTEAEAIKSYSLILATGASAKWLGIPSEQKLIGRGVSACAVCDGFFFKDKDVLVIGGGDTAMREAHHLSKLCSRVTVIHRRDQLRAQAALQDLVKSRPNIDFIYNKVVDEILGDALVTGVRLRDTATNIITKLDTSGVFVAIGHKPNTDFVNGQIERDAYGYIVTHSEVKTSVDGVFAAGDNADKEYRQAVTAAGSGVKAVFEAEKYLEDLKLS